MTAALVLGGPNDTQSFLAHLDRNQVFDLLALHMIVYSSSHRVISVGNFATSSGVVAATGSKHNKDDDNRQRD